MAEEPLVRASIPKTSWAEIERSPPGIKDKILRALGPQFAAELSSAVTVAWVPFSIEARIADAAYQALGPMGTRSFYREKTLRSFDIPWLRPLVTSSLRLFGATPNSFLKMLPRTWVTLSRHCGSYGWEDEGIPKRGVSIVSGFPGRLYKRKEAWLESAMGGYEAFFQPFRLQGSVLAEDVDATAGNARFILNW